MAHDSVHQPLLKMRRYASGIEEVVPPAAVRETPPGGISTAGP